MRAKAFNFMQRHWWLASLVALVIIASALFSLAESIERTLFPVVEKFEVLSIVRDDDTVLVSGTLIKARKCQIVGLRAMSEADSMLQVEYLDRPHGADLFTRPTGLSTWGPWRVHPGSARYVTLISEHRCHWFWTVETPLASFQVKPRYAP